MARPLEIQCRPVGELLPYARNSRTHSEEQVAELAASLDEFGMVGAIVVRDGVIAKGHGTLAAVRKLYAAGKRLYPPPGRAQGAEPFPDGTVPVLDASGWTDAQFRAFVIADNKLGLNAGWDFDMLSVELDELRDDDFDLGILGFSQQELNDLIGTQNTGPGDDDSGGSQTGDADEMPDVEPIEVSKTGDVWQLGPHRVMCGDSTIVADVAALMGDQKAALLHADTPYGMGFDDEGVANDDLAGADLSAFQMAWYKAARPFLQNSASVYVWGWEDSLFEFYLQLRKDTSDRITKRNYIVWDKKHGQGISQPDLRRFAPVTEHCLFFMLGEQQINTNADNYWEGWEPVRLMLHEAVAAQGWKAKDLNRITGTQMGSHWITQSQWSFITEPHYAKLLDAAHNPGAFPAYGDLQAEYEAAKRDNDEHRRRFYAGRAYFDNTHDAMTDVWRFKRVTGDERHGHATPKPVAMMERVMRSSLPDGGLCFEPFGGSGSTLMGAEKTARVCYSMELQAKYIDVIVRRWQAFTGKKATLYGDGRTFDEIAAERTQASPRPTDSVA